MKPAVKSYAISRYQEAEYLSKDDLLVVEEPLELVLDWGSGEERRSFSLAVTMRTPGHDEDLALGFLFSEGIIQDVSQIHSLRHCVQLKSPEEEGNRMRIFLKEEVEWQPEQHQRHFYATSSCGICGKSSMEAICQKLPPPAIGNPLNWEESLIRAINQGASAKQTLFKHTGGLHSCTLFDRSGNPILQREDIGRHNALDKLIGAAKKRLDLPPLKETVLHLSGRAGFEMIQKAAMAQIPYVIAIGAPSSLALDMAEQQGICLIGFFREDRYNVYTHPKAWNSQLG